MKKLWLVTELFYPEETSTAYILTRIANSLAGDIELHVICGPSSYDDEKIGSTIHELNNKLDPRIVIHRVSETKLDKNKLIGRILRFIVLSYKLSSSLWYGLKPQDEIFIVTNPAPLLLIVSLIKKIKKNTLYILVHDVFPENTIPANIISSDKSLFYRFLKWAFNHAYRQADIIIVLGRDMKNLMENKLGANKNETRIEIIENWAESDIIKARYEKDSRYSKDKIDIQYAGNLGRVQGLLPFLERVCEAGNDLIRISFWGGGAVKQDMETYVRKNNLQNISFHGNYKRSDQNVILNNCDLALITLADGMRGLGVPSKTYNILAAGKPILYIGDLSSEIALLIQEYGLGFCFDPGDKEGITDFLKSLTIECLKDFETRGRKARILAETIYSEVSIMHKYHHLLID